MRAPFLYTLLLPGGTLWTYEMKVVEDGGAGCTEGRMSSLAGISWEFPRPGDLGYMMMADFLSSTPGLVEVL